jgi:hypothetical protein
LTRDQEDRLYALDEVWRATIWRTTEQENSRTWPQNKFIGPRESRAAENEEWETRLTIRTNGIPKWTPKAIQTVKNHKRYPDTTFKLLWVEPVTLTKVPRRIQPSKLQVDPLIAAANFRACMAKINDEDKDKA